MADIREDNKARPPAVKLQDMREASTVVGAGVVAYGFWLAWHPLGFIMGGAMLVGLGVLGTLTGNR